MYDCVCESYIYNTGALVSGVRLERSSRTGGAARCTTVSASRALKQASRIRRRVEVPSRHQVAEQHLVESGRRVRLMSRIVDVVELSGLERFSILHNHRHNHRRQG